MTDLDASIDAALVHLERAATEAALHDDPLQRPFTALASFLRAQRTLYAAGAASLAQHIEAAKQPVQDEALRRAVIQGISAHARAVVAAINLRTAAWLAFGTVVVALLGFAGGAWWQNSRLSAQIADADRIMVDAHALGSIVLSARSAALWTELVRLNPNVADEFRDCQPLKQPAGSACALPVWTMAPPPKVATPATH